MKFYFPKDTSAVICHNRMTTQGSELQNYKTKRYSTIVASKDNLYVRRYAADHRIKIIDSLNGKDDS